MTEPIDGSCTVSIALKARPFGISRDVRFLVLKSVDKVILGTDAMEKFPLNLDWKERCLVTKDGRHKSCVS